jgi:hypothetical protein
MKGQNSSMIANAVIELTRPLDQNTPSWRPAHHRRPIPTRACFECRNSTAGKSKAGHKAEMRLPEYPSDGYCTTGLD